MILKKLYAGNLLVCWPKNDNSGSCLKQKNATFTPANIINFFIVYELDTWSRDLKSDLNLKDFIEFDSRSEFSSPDGSVGENVVFLELIWAHLCILIIRTKIS